MLFLLRLHQLIEKFAPPTIGDNAYVGKKNFINGQIFII